MSFPVYCPVSELYNVSRSTSSVIKSPAYFFPRIQQLGCPWVSFPARHSKLEPARSAPMDVRAALRHNPGNLIARDNLGIRSGISRSTVSGRSRPAEETHARPPELDQSQTPANQRCINSNSAKLCSGFQRQPRVAPALRPPVSPTVPPDTRCGAFSRRATIACPWG